MVYLCNISLSEHISGIAEQQPQIKAVRVQSATVVEAESRQERWGGGNSKVDSLRFQNEGMAAVRASYFLCLMCCA